jgi:hypothetical protein
VNSFASSTRCLGSDELLHYLVRGSHQKEKAKEGLTGTSEGLGPKAHLFLCFLQPDKGTDRLSL